MRYSPHPPSPLLPHNDDVYGIAWHPDSSLLVTTSRDGTARIWNVSDYALITTLKGHAGAVLSATFSPGGTTIITVETEGVGRVWDVQGSLLMTLPVQQGEVTSVTVSPDGTLIATAGCTGRDVAEMFVLTTRENAIQVHSFVVPMFVPLQSP